MYILRVLMFSKQCNPAVSRDDKGFMIPVINWPPRTTLPLRYESN